MNQTAVTAFLDLPPWPGRSCLRAGLTAMNLTPWELEPHRRLEFLSSLHQHPRSVVFVDISPRPDRPRLLELDAAMPRGPARARVFLTRLLGGHVSASERRWVGQLGFADLLCGLDSQDSEGRLRSAVDAVARLLARPPVPAEKLARYATTMPDDVFREMPWRTVRTLSGQDPEALADTMEASLEIKDRSYRMTNYAHCFLGSEATGWLERRFRLSRDEAVRLGNAMVSLGLLVHVVQEHPFRDEPLFYRMAVSAAGDRVDLGAAAAALMSSRGVAVADRSYHGRFAQCWVGSEAVDFLCGSGLRRHDAWVALHRLAQCGVFDHVTSERPFLDGEFFYRFAGKEPHASRAAAGRH